MRVMRTLPAAILSVAIIPLGAAQESDADRADRPVTTSQAVQFKPSFTIGFDYSEGDFGDANGLDTTTISVPVSARVDVGDFRFSVSGSWVQIEGPGGVLPGGVIVGDEATAAALVPELETNDGFGDLTLGVNYNVPASVTGKFLVQLQGRLKVPTASNDALTTNEVDGGFAVDVAYQLGDFTPFVTTGFRFRGDPEGAELNNTFNVSVGGSYNLGGGYAIVGSYDFRQATTDTAEESQEVFGALAGKFNDKLRWTLYGSVGFTDGAPDQGAGVQLIASF
jgi:hypothetical protein